MGEIAGRDNIVSSSRMNNAIVHFLNSVEKVNEVVQSGVASKGSLLPAFPLTIPSKKITLSNVRPFVKDQIPAQELSCYIN